LAQFASASGAWARDILSGAAQALATRVAAVRRQLFPEGEAVRVYYSGGAFRSGLLLERYRMLVELEDGAFVAPPVYSPAVGALIEAYRLAGRNPNQLETISWNLSRTSSTRIA
jgi:hypothetical protein